MEIISSIALLIFSVYGIAQIVVAIAKDDIRREQESENAWLEWERANGHVYY